MKIFPKLAGVLLLLLLAYSCASPVTPESPLTDWTRLMGNSSGGSYGFGIATDSQDNIYTGGYTIDGIDGIAGIGTQDIFLTKHDKNGNKQWAKVIGIFGQASWGYRIAVDSSDNVYMIGSTSGNLDGETLAGYQDGVLTKYSSNGTRLWTKLLGVGFSNTQITTIYITANDTIYIAGSTDGNLGGQTLSGSSSTAAFLANYNTSGISQWIILHESVDNSLLSYGIDTDSSGNIYLAGHTTGDLGGQTITGNNDAYLSKFDSSGTHQWTRLTGTNLVSTQGKGLGIDSTNNIYVLARTTGGLDGQSMNGTIDIAIMKYDINGNKAWTRQFGVSTKITEPYGLAMDTNNNPVLIGYTQGNLNGAILNGTADAFVVTVSSSGVATSTKLFGNSGVGTLGGAGCFDEDGNIFITGYCLGSLEGQTFHGVQDVFVTSHLNF